MAFNLDLDAFVIPDKTKPSNIELIYHMFWSKGIDYHAFNKLPIPYIMGILKTYNYVEKEKEKAYNKANKKK